MPVRWAPAVSCRQHSVLEWAAMAVIESLICACAVHVSTALQVKQQSSVSGCGSYEKPGLCLWRS